MKGQQIIDEIAAAVEVILKRNEVQIDGDAAQLSFGRNSNEAIQRFADNVLILQDDNKWGRNVGNTTLGVGVVTFVCAGMIMIVTGDGGGNTIATITGGVAGEVLTLIFVDANVTITDTNAHTANTVDLAGDGVDLTSADDTVLQLMFDGTSWYEVSRSVNS